MAAKNKPVHQVRIGRVKAAIFENGDDAPRKVQFRTLYKNEEDQWRGSSSFAREDLPLLIKVADQVHSYLYEQSEQNGNNGSSEDISF